MESLDSWYTLNGHCEISEVDVLAMTSIQAKLNAIRNSAQDAGDRLPVKRDPCFAHTCLIETVLPIITRWVAEQEETNRKNS
jgi:hypothetical protein